MLDNNKIKNIAELAKLDVSNNLEELTTDLNKFLDLIDQLQALDTKDIEPMAHPFDFKQRLRDDVVTATNNRESLQKIAPETTQGHYLVPKVL